MAHPRVIGIVECGPSLSHCKQVRDGPLLPEPLRALTHNTEL